MANRAAVVLDTQGFNLIPELLRWSNFYEIPPVATLALIRAESNLNPAAARLGRWPDISYGLGQQTVLLAGVYKVGDGSYTKANLNRVRFLLTQPLRSIILTSQVLRDCLHKARLHGDSTHLGGLVTYNCGHYPLSNDLYWKRYGSSVQRYRSMLMWAQTILGS